MSTTAPAQMKVDRNDLNACTVQFEIVCTPDQIETGFSRAAKEFSKRIKIPGFRPGTAPQRVVEKMIDPDELTRAAIDEIIRIVLVKVLDDEKIVADNSPAVNITKFNRAEGQCEFGAKVPLPPVVKLGEYKGIKITVPPVEVSESEIDKQISELRSRKGQRAEIVGRGIAEGDMAVVNIKPDGDTGEGRTFMIVVGQSFPSLDSILTGMGAEEIKHGKLSFPAEFQEKDWAKKSFEATITVRSATATQLPDLDDSFAQSLKANDVKDLKDKVKTGIERAKMQMGQEMINEQIFDQLLASSEVEVPDTTWEQVTNKRLQELAYELGQQKKTVEDYVKENGMDVNEYVKRLQDEAKVQVKRAVLIESIFKEEKFEIDNNDINRHFLHIAAENQVPEAELEKFAKKYGANLRQEIVFRTMHAKVVEFLNEHAERADGIPKSKPKKTEPKVDSKSEEKPAKKKETKAKE